MATVSVYIAPSRMMKEQMNMRKGLTITHGHGWTVERLQAHEKTIKKHLWPNEWPSFG
jgi:hypothetical protein